MAHSTEGGGLANKDFVLKTGVTAGSFRFHLIQVKKALKCVFFIA